MTETADPHAHAHHEPPAPPHGWHRFTYPGWLRALWTTPGFGMFWVGFAVLVRYLAHWGPYWSGVPLVTIATVSFPLGLLIGIGAFDYWAYYFAGKPTLAEDHSGHG